MRLASIGVILPVVWAVALLNSDARADLRIGALQQASANPESHALARRATTRRTNRRNQYLARLRLLNLRMRAIVGFSNGASQGASGSQSNSTQRVAGPQIGLMFLLFEIDPEQIVHNLSSDTHVCTSDPPLLGLFRPPRAG